MIPPGVLLAIATLVIGWVVLLPIRERLGLPGYHIAAVPVGVLGWAVVASISMGLSSAWTPTLVLSSLFGWALAVWLMARVIDAAWPVRAEDLVPFARWTYLLVFVGLTSYAWVFAQIGVSAFSADGWSQYEPDGIVLNESGLTTPRALGNRMVAVSALHAAYHFFGGEFTHVIQPVLALVTALLVAIGLWWMSAGRLSGTARVMVSVVPPIAMITNAVYVFHSVYIHSHMVSTMFLTLAVVAIGRWWVGGADPYWLLIAGLSTAGVVLARPDGAAYAVVPIIVVVALLVRAKAVPAAADAFFGPLIGVVLIVVAGGVLQHGVWWTRKLSLQTMLLFLGAYGVAWLLTRAISGCGRFNLLRSGTSILWLLLVVDVVALVAVWWFWFDSVLLSYSNMMSNLLRTGGYRSFWPLAAALLGASLLLRPRSTRHPFAAYALLAIGQFLVIAFVLHGIRHPGRMGWGDSFTRVSFQIMPTIYLYAGLYVTGLLHALKRTRGGRHMGPRVVDEAIRESNSSDAC